MTPEDVRRWSKGAVLRTLKLLFYRLIQLSRLTYDLVCENRVTWWISSSYQNNIHFRRGGELFACNRVIHQLLLEHAFAPEHLMPTRDADPFFTSLMVLGLVLWHEKFIHEIAAAKAESRQKLDISVMSLGRCNPHYLTIPSYLVRSLATIRGPGDLAGVDLRYSISGVSTSGCELGRPSPDGTSVRLVRLSQLCSRPTLSESNSESGDIAQ